MKKKQSIKYSVLVITLIVGAYFLANRMLPAPNSAPNDENGMIKLDMIVYHVCQNKRLGDVIIQIPNVTDVYQQILTANADKYPNILLFPTYPGSWEDELAWLTNNFGGENGIPIMFEVFYPGEPVLTKLTNDQILDVMKVCNVKWLRIAEVISRCLDFDFTFPSEYVSDLLNFCRDHNLKVFWTEWKVDNLPDVEMFTKIKALISGFEDIVTVSFSTNSEEMEPTQGFAYMKSLFLHWGGSVQSWYNETRVRIAEGREEIDEEESRNMSISLMIDHALLCRDMGAEIIQFEPYWYFFGDTDGQARTRLKLMHDSLNSK
jgi:hypothetical protein